MRSRFSDSPFEGQLEVIATLSEEATVATMQEQIKWQNLMQALREMLDQGIAIDELSNASGLSPDQIRKVCQKIRPRDEDLLALFGLK